MLVSNSQLNRALKALFSPPSSQNKSVSEKGFHYILRTVISEVKSSRSHLACRLCTLPSTSRSQNMLAELSAFPRPLTLLSLGLNQVGSVCSAAAGEQESTPSPHFPSDLNYQIIRASAFFSLLPLAVVSVFKKTRESRFTVQDLALIFFFFFTAPATLQLLSHHRLLFFCSLNATGLSLAGCIAVFTAYL